MPTKRSFITVTDQFCGAGGSSIGAEASGAQLVMALNHWKLAIETHATNFPNAGHDCTDISACDPRRYPSTDILLTSPECTNHSLAKGKKRKMQAQMELFGKVTIDPAEERSRATMWDVPRFAEFHDYRIIIVENVVDARHWRTWDAWLHAMHLLGYDHQIVYLNSQFAHVRPHPSHSLAAGDYAPSPATGCMWCSGNEATAALIWIFAQPRIAPTAAAMWMRFRHGRIQKRSGAAMGHVSSMSTPARPVPKR